MFATLTTRLGHKVSGTWGHFGCESRGMGEAEHTAWSVPYWDFRSNESSIS